MGDFVNLGDVIRRELGMQCQYGSRYADPVWSEDDRPWPYCGNGLRINGNTKDYHSMTIHKDDIREFVNRVNNVRYNY